MNAMLISSGLPKNLWGEALLSANYILNKLSHRKTYKIPYELWKYHKPNYKYLRVWGCLNKVVVPKLKKVQIWPKTIDCVLIGYAYHSSAYRFMVHKSKIPDVHVNTIIESKDTTFFENVFPYNLQSESNSLKRPRDNNEVVDQESINER